MGLVTPRLTWTATLKDQHKVSLRIGAHNSMSGLVYIETRDISGQSRIGLVKSHALSALNVDAFHLRDRRLLTVQDKDISLLQLQLDNQQKIRLFHDGPQQAPWRFDASSKDNKTKNPGVQHEAVARVLQTLRSSLWAQKWTLSEGDNKPKNLDINWTQARSLQILGFQKNTLAELRISPLSNEPHYVWRVDKNILYLIKDRSLDQFPHLREDLLQKREDDSLK